MTDEGLARHLALDTQIGLLLTSGVIEEKSRWAEQLLLGQPGPLLGRIVGDIELDADEAIQADPYAGVIDDFPFDHLAADAPVGGQLDDRRLPLFPGLGQLLADGASRW